MNRSERPKTVFVNPVVSCFVRFLSMSRSMNLVSRIFHLHEQIPVKLSIPPLTEAGSGTVLLVTMVTVCFQLDHDVCSNYGNWNYSAGIGNDPRENRKFNMIKQATDYDPQVGTSPSPGRSVRPARLPTQRPGP